MKVGGLFSGIGGLELGLQRVGFDIAWHCEADEFCRRVLERHWPGVPCYPDVTTLSGGMVEPIDMLCGGFPCQDLSIAGKGSGIDGARSGLWFEYLRLIRELRPRYVIVENVPTLRSRGLDRVLGGLAASGYDAEWDCIPASAVGAPHQRDRIWLVAYPQHEPHKAERGQRSTTSREGSSGRDDGGRGARDAERQITVRGAGKDSGAALGDANGAGLQGVHETRGRVDLQPTSSPVRRDWPPEPPLARVAYGIPRRLVRDEIHALGNALVPRIPEWIGRRILAYEGLA